MTGLREANEPKPWERAGLPIRVAIYGKVADQAMSIMFGRGPDICVVTCDGCGRWEHFPHVTIMRFEAIRAASKATGWKRIEGRDLCPICARG